MIYSYLNKTTLTFKKKDLTKYIPFISWKYTTLFSKWFKRIWKWHLHFQKGRINSRFQNRQDSPASEDLKTLKWQFHQTTKAGIPFWITSKYQYWIKKQYCTNMVPSCPNLLLAITPTYCNQTSNFSNTVLSIFEAVEVPYTNYYYVN